MLTYGRGGWRGSLTGQHTTFRQSDYTCVLHVEAIFLFGSLFLTTLPAKKIFKNCLYRHLDILGVLKSCQMKINHIWPEYVKVGPGAVRDILRCGVGTHQYISRSHLSPSGVQSPGVGWDVGRVHKGGGVEELANRSISRVPRITSGSSGDTLPHNTLRAGQLLVPRLEKSQD